MMRWLGYTAGGTAACIAYTIPQIHDWAVAWLLVDALVLIGLMLLAAQFIELRREVAHDEWRRRIDVKAAEARAYRTMVLGAGATVEPTVTGRVLDEHGNTVGCAYGGNRMPPRPGEPPPWWG